MAFNNSNFVKIVSNITHDPKYNDILMNYKSAHDQYKGILNFIKNLPEDDLSQFRRMLYQFFNHFYLDLITKGENTEAEKFWNEHSRLFLESSGYEKTLTDLKNLNSVEDIIKHPIFYLYRIDRFVLEISEKCKISFLQYLHNNKFTWALRIIDLFFTIECYNDSVAASNKSEGKEESNVSKVIEKVNKLPLALPSILLYSLEGSKTSSSKVPGIGLSHNASMVGIASENSSINLWQFTDADRNQNYNNSSQQNKVFGKILTSLQGHADQINSIVFHPLDTLLFSCSNDSTIRAWITNNDYKTAAVYKGQGGRIWDMDISSNGINFVSGSSNNAVCLFHIINDKPLHSFEVHKSSVNCVKFNSDGKIFATGSKDKTVLMWSLDINKAFSIFTHDGSVSSLKFSPYKNYLASVCTNKIQIWDYRNSTMPLRKLHCDSDVYSLSFNKNGRILAAGTTEAISFYDLDAPDDGVNKPFGKFHAPHSYVPLIRFYPLKSNLLTAVITSNS